MSNYRYCYYVVLAEKGIEGIEETIASVLGSSYSEYQRIIIVDNQLSMDDYKSLIQIEIKFKSSVSVLRLKEKTTRGRMVKATIERLRLLPEAYLVFLNPGDKVHCNFYDEVHAAFFKYKDIRQVIVEAEGQDAIFDKNRILGPQNRQLILENGAYHKIFIVYHSVAALSLYKLPHLEVVSRNHDWLSAYLMNDTRSYYIHEKLGTINESIPLDVKKYMIQNAFFVKRCFYAVETQVFSDKTVAKKNNRKISWYAYRHLAQTAIKLAELIYEQDSIGAEEMLIFAEMIFDDFNQLEEFHRMKQLISGE